MSRVFASDITHSLVFEATYGVTPTTGTRYAIPLNASQGLLPATPTEIKDDTLYPNRAGGGSTRGMVTLSGNLNQRFYQAEVVDHLFESALGGVFTAGVLKGGTVDKSFTLLSQLGAAGTKAYSGCLVKGFTLDAKGDAAVNLDWQVVGTGYDPNNTPAITTVTGTGVTHAYTSLDVKNVTVAGATLQYSELSFSTMLDRPFSPVLGSSKGLAPGVNGARQTTVTIKAYRDSLSLDGTLTGDPQAFSFDVVNGGVGYTFSAPGMIFTIPVDELNNGSCFVTIKGSAKYDATLDSDVSITKK